MGAAAEWQDILKEVVKGMIILAILERLHLTRPVNWLEEHGASQSQPARLWLHAHAFADVALSVCSGLLFAASTAVQGAEPVVLAADTPVFLLPLAHLRLGVVCAASNNTAQMQPAHLRRARR
jgi:hypothetical protein